MTAAQHIAALSMPFDPNGRHAAQYAHRPQPSGLHAKFLRELSTYSPYLIRPAYAMPANHIRVVRCGDDGLPREVVWRGHRDSMPARYRGASDPYRCLTTPASD